MHALSKNNSTKMDQRRKHADVCICAFVHTQRILPVEAELWLSTLHGVLVTDILDSIDAVLVYEYACRRGGSSGMRGSVCGQTAHPA